MIDFDGARLGAEAARRLAESDCCETAPGLEEDEFSRFEATYFEFSPEHRAFLAGLPVASPPEEGATWQQPWPDWRHADSDDLRHRLEWPVREVPGSVAALLLILLFLGEGVQAQEGPGGLSPQAAGHCRRW
ncbi:hypothetical protein [Streptomyces collinus]|uniref:hypothetical protein n=1 Tax=Streptomyces collinus TaxID=42684 RepID=UPI003643E088